ncbi:MAG: class I SAM-dependent methyltransferase [Planctomycetota bacterium]
MMSKLMLPFRKRRMARFVQDFGVSGDTRILDVGGTAFNWSLVGYPGAVKIANVSALELARETPARYATEIADATDLPYEDKSFEITFSNSVIEHVGDYEQQKRFAAEARRVAHGLCIQTPARCFFLEPHYLTPFIHWLSSRWQKRLLRNFTVWGLMSRPDKRTVERCVDTTRLLNYRQLQELFPDCEIRSERFLLLTKSYLVVRKPA